MNVQVTRQIMAPRQRVFDVFTDLRSAADRISGIESVEVHTDGPTAQGTRWTETRKMMGKSATETMTITAFDPPNSYTAEARSHGSHYLSTFTFQTDGAGTKVTLSFTGTPTNLLSKLFMIMVGPLMMGSVKKLLAQDLDDLKKSCESEPAGV